MIKVEKIDIWGFEHAIRGMRNPLNSHSKSDTEVAFHALPNFSPDDEMAKKFEEWNDIYGLNVKIGPNDLDLMRRLYKAGPEHRKYLRQIFVSMDITAPLYWISEFDTYKIGTTRNSCSFMHKGVSKPFEITDFSVCDELVYQILTPIEQTSYPLLYEYETDEYREYVCANGRKYEVFKNGRVFSEPFEYVDTMGRHRIFERCECIPNETARGYYELRLGGKNGEKWLLHRLVATVWLDNPSNLYTVNHIDGNKGNNCVENLEWCSLTDNIRKGFDAGLYENLHGIRKRYFAWKNGHTVVDPYTRLQILDDYHSKHLSTNEIAKKYGITYSQANNIAHSRFVLEQDHFMLANSWERIIDHLNSLRSIYLETKDNNVFQQIRCLLPCGYNQRFTITMNYENVITMIKQRTGHKLDEWNEFCDILRGLPYIKEITED